MNNKIMINGDEVFVQTDEGLIKVTGKNVSEKLLLENYIEYLENKIKKLTNIISSEDYSNMELKDIIKDLWENNPDFKMLLMLAGCVGYALPFIIVFCFFTNYLISLPILSKLFVSAIIFSGSAALGAYSEAKKQKKNSIKNKKNIEIANEQKELIEKELLTIPALIKSESLTTTLNKDLPEIQRLYNFGDAYYVGSDIITLKDEPVSGALRRLRR